MIKQILTICLCLLLKTICNAQSNLDFWVGNWNVISTTSGNIIGESHVSKALNKKVFLENYSDVIGTKGKSFTIYDSIQHCWKQTWVDNTGSVAEFTGILHKDTMLFIGTAKMNSAGKTIIHRMTIIKTSENELQQTEESSDNNSFTWQTNYSFLYKRQSTYSLTNQKFIMKLYGIKLKASNLETANKFYIQTLGFHVDQSYQQPNEIQLYTNSFKIILVEDKNMKKIPDNHVSDVSFCMLVNNLDSAYQNFKSKGVSFLTAEKRKEGIGYSMKIFDPFGNQISLMQLFPQYAYPITEPYIYNCGYYVGDMDKARKFYSETLGFLETTKDYLPDDMPLYYADKSFAFMLHAHRPEFKHTNTPNSKLQFAVSDLEALKELLRKNNIKFNEANNILTFTDNNNIQSDVIKTPSNE